MLHDIEGREGPEVVSYSHNAVVMIALVGNPHRNNVERLGYGHKSHEFAIKCAHYKDLKPAYYNLLFLS